MDTDFVRWYFYGTIVVSLIERKGEKIPFTSGKFYYDLA